MKKALTLKREDFWIEAKTIGEEVKDLPYKKAIQYIREDKRFHDALSNHFRHPIIVGIGRVFGMPDLDIMDGEVIWGNKYHIAKTNEDWGNIAEILYSIVLSDKTKRLYLDIYPEYENIFKYPHRSLFETLGGLPLTKKQ